MKTLEQKIKDLTDKHNKEILAAQDHDRLAAKIPSLKRAMYHDYELYGRKASINLDVETLEQAIQLIDELKAANVELVPMGIERDSCTSVKKLDLCKPDKTQAVAPIVYNIDSFKSEIDIFCMIDGTHYEITIRSAFRAMPFFRLMSRRLKYKSEYSDKAIDCTLHYSSDFMDKEIKWWASDIEHSSYSIFSSKTDVSLSDLRKELETKNIIIK